MGELQISHQELADLVDEALGLAKAYWATVEQRPAYPATSGADTARLFSGPWHEDGRGREVLDDFNTIAAHSRPSGGKFFGYVFGSGEPVGALGELLTAVLNQNVTAWRSGPAATTIEQAVVGWLADAVGCTGFTGSLCGGGSAANLMALAMAREARLPANETGAQPGVIYASEQVHMSIPKAIALLGLGRRNLRLIPVDEAFRMRVDALEATIAEDRKAGNTPIAIVATVGTIATGAIDPLPEIADIARREALWMHVDGAFGGLAAMAVPEKCQGLSRADSLSLDAHKWLYQPLECGCLLYRDPQIARETFSHSGDYVKALSEDPKEAFAFFEETIELSRRFRALKLWMSLQYHGRRAFREAIARDLLHAQMLA
jgi:aromatic-L-amino-acid/L-tryptophan decarboxylase